MKLGPQTVSALVHLGLLAAVVFLVKTEARLPTSISAFISGESEEKPPPPAPPPPVPSPSPDKARSPRATGRARPAAAPAEPGETSGSPGSGPLMDLGLLELDDSGPIPEGAVVIAGGAEPEKSAPVAPPPPIAPTGCTEEPTSPEPISRTDVEYPPGLAGMAGRVLARATVSTEGLVLGVEIIGSLDPAIDQAVKESLAKWRFRPARRCQKAVIGSWTLALRFEQPE